MSASRPPRVCGTSLAERKGVISGRTLVVTLIGSGCIAAAGVGSYLAVRTASHPAAAEHAVVQPAAVETTQAAVESAAPSQPAATSPVPAPSTLDTSAASTPTSRVTPANPPRVMAPGAAESRRVARRAARREVRRMAAAETVQRHPVPAQAHADDPARTAPAEAPVSSNVLDPSPGVPDMRIAESADLPASSAGATLPEPLDEVVIGRHSVIGIRLESPISSATARLEDHIAGRVTRDVIVDGRIAIPSGSLVDGVVTMVERGGRFRERARVGIRFTSVTVAEDMRVPIETETIFREGDPPGGEATSKVGSGAVIGAIIGAVLGGKRGAAVGAGAGAAGGTAVVMTSDANPATIPSGTTLTVRLSAPATVLIQHDLR
jgi:hypothetical protein